MKINKTNVKKMVWVEGWNKNYTLHIDSSIPEADARRLVPFGGCTFSGAVSVGDYRLAMTMQRLIREALIGLELPEPKGC